MRIKWILPILSVVALAACGPKPIDVQCTDSVQKIKTMTEGKNEFAVKCPAGCGQGSIWGTDIYTTDSSICKAALHAGVIKQDGGKVSVELLPGQDSYEGSERNGVTTSSWPSYGSSFKVK
ncbi:MAG: hypothetical protein KDK37_03080 [Leptospiraceae bacterium]|nr:hypothetical protein [Leptospiraceae bacterium]MCB1303227.1 hypothetical protein [Leptospiraceae bacterium]